MSCRNLHTTIGERVKRRLVGASEDTLLPEAFVDSVGERTKRRRTSEHAHCDTRNTTTTTTTTTTARTPRAVEPAVTTLALRAATAPSPSWFGVRLVKGTPRTPSPPGVTTGRPRAPSPLLLGYTATVAERTKHDLQLLPRPPPKRFVASPASTALVVWPGVVSVPRPVRPVPRPYVPNGNRVRVLDLFCGTQSCAKVARQLGYEVVTLDRDLRAKHRTDLMDWDYQKYPRGHFTFVCCSPPCHVWSSIRRINLGKPMRGTTRCWTRTKFRRDEKAEQVLIRRMFDILEYFAPRYYWIENPGASRLKGFLDVFRPQLKSVVVDYCMYSQWQYRKRTRFWACDELLEGFKPRQCNKRCRNFADGRHRVWLDDMPACGKSELHTKYRIPPKLVRALFESVA